MGAQRFDALQEQLPADVAILGIDAYTSVTFDAATETASVSGQGSITLIGDGAERNYSSGTALSFAAFSSSAREVVKTFDESRVYKGYEFSDNEAATAADGFGPVVEHVESLASLAAAEKVELLARLQSLRSAQAAAPADDGDLIDLVLELREALRAQKRFDLADRARDALEAQGIEIGD